VTDGPRDGETPTSPDQPGPASRRLPPHVTMGLLDNIAATALDADYAAVARRRAEGGREGGGGPRPRPGARVGTVLVLVTFALLLSVAAVQAARNEPVREAGRRSLLDQVEERRDQLTEARSELATMRREVTTLRSSQLAGSEEGRALESRLQTLGAVVGARPVTGPGMVVTVDDAIDARSNRQRVLDGDLQRLVNGLWLAGAEAIAINGQRLTQLSAIRTAGEAIHVNFKPLRPPYVVAAIGNPDQMPARFIETRGGAWWLNLRAVYEVRFDMSSREEILLPTVDIGDLRLARTPEAGP
jgi:uncharacterized protein YlxW (UPF0749 family)